MSKQIAILGSGPAGLIAADTLVRLFKVPESQISIITAQKKRSYIGGAQYLHEPVGCGSGRKPDLIIDHVHLGTPEGYARKVYGDEGEQTSWDAHEGRIEAWNLKKIYDKLFVRWLTRMTERNVNWAELLKIREEYPGGVISTIPAWFTCRGMHQAIDDQIHEFPKVRTRLVPMPVEAPFGNFVAYSGRIADDWFRLSKIGADRTWGEFSPHMLEQAFPHQRPKGTINAEKPMGTNCNCNQPLKVVRVGRFGMWDRQQLLHHIPTHIENALGASLIEVY